MIAYGIITVPSSPSSGGFSIGLWGGVRPSHRRRGIGRDLLQAWRPAPRTSTATGSRAPEPARRRRARPHQDRRHLLERAGYSIERWFIDMDRDLTEPVEDLRPRGPDLAAFDWAHDDAVRRAHSEAFATHWGSSQRSPEEWQRWFTGDRHFRPDLSFVVLDGDEVTAYALTTYPEEDEMQGYTSGWLQASSAPGRPGAETQLGTSLLRRIVATMQADGLDRAALNVDSQNATGALALYERGASAPDPEGRLHARDVIPDLGDPAAQRLAVAVVVDDVVGRASRSSRLA